MKTANIHLNCIVTHNIYNALASFAVAKSLGMNDTEIITALERYETTGIRQNLDKLDNNYVFIDCYNASRESIQGALRSFDLLRCNNIKSLAIVGDVQVIGDNVVEIIVTAEDNITKKKYIVTVHRRNYEEEEKTEEHREVHAEKLSTILQQNNNINDNSEEIREETKNKTPINEEKSNKNENIYVYISAGIVIAIIIIFILYKKRKNK